LRQKKVCPFKKNVLELKKIIVLSLFIFFPFSALAATCVNADSSTNSTTADFSATPASGVAPLRVYFTDLSTGNPAIQSWTWDFRDGNNSLYRILCTSILRMEVIP
jgi:PKD repeat protein